jgi:hypothetical protein
MNRQSISSSMLATVVAIMLTVPCAASADGGPYGYGRYPGNPPYHAPYYPRYYPHYYHYYPCNNCGNNNHHNNHNNSNEKLWIGLLGGGILGYTLGNIYPAQQYTGQGYNPPAGSAPPPTVSRYETTYPGPCLQQREYRSKVMVGGKQVDGYGTACLQPDGSWRYGPAQAEPY